jgi:hypothetical protein
MTWTQQSMRNRQLYLSTLQWWVHKLLIYPARESSYYHDLIIRWWRLEHFLSCSTSLTLKWCAFQQDIDVALGRTQSAEILDDMFTRSRGEIKRLNSPKITSSGGTPVTELKGLRSPCISEKAYSPRVTELRHERSPLGRRDSPRTGETRPSKFGEGSTPKWRNYDGLLI